jgi:hypothetical protein
MKKTTVHSREINRISRRENLPLLRGMFVTPEPAGRKYKTVQRNANDLYTSEEGLFLTSDQGCYLGE